MSDIFLHGIQNVTVDDGARPITTVRSSTDRFNWFRTLMPTL